MKKLIDALTAFSNKVFFSNRYNSRESFGDIAERLVSEYLLRLKKMGRFADIVIPRSNSVMDLEMAIDFMAIEKNEDEYIFHLLQVKAGTGIRDTYPHNWEDVFDKYMNDMKYKVYTHVIHIENIGGWEDESISFSIPRKNTNQHITSHSWLKDRYEKERLSSTSIRRGRIVKIIKKNKEEK